MSFKEEFIEASAGRTPEELSELLDISCPTIKAWFKGYVEPHRLMVPGILKALKTRDIPNG